MSDDYRRWIYNPTYNDAKRRDEQLARVCSQADRKVTDAKQRLSSVDNKIINQTNLDRKELDSKLARERERLLNGLDSLDESLRSELSRQNVRFREQLDAIRRDVDGVNARVRQVDQRITDLAEQFRNNIDHILSHIANQKERARAYSNHLGLLLEQISELHPDKLTPGEYEQLSEGLAYVESDVKNGDYEAAIGVAQTHIPVATELRSRLEILNDEFAQLVVQIHDRCNEIYNRIQSLCVPENNQQTILQDPEKVEFDGRIPFWTNGVFDAIVEHFEQIREKVASDYELAMDIESLRGALDDILGIDPNLDECVSFAHSECMESAAVQSLVTRIHRSLTSDNEWHIISDGFIDGDERRSYSLSYNSAGLTAAFVVMPARDVVRRNRDGSVNYGETRFRVDVFQSDADEDSQLCSLTRDGILTRLKDDNIDIGNNSDSQCASNNSEEFITTATLEGDKIKDDRVVSIKGRMGL